MRGDYMSIKIFYFSGTGNSLSVARSIAGGLEDAELVSIPKTMDGDIDTTAETVGFVFPVYGWGMPRIVEGFVDRLDLSRVKYIYAVVTCAGTQGGTLLQLKKMLQEKKNDLHAGFAVKEQSHSPMKQVLIEKFVIWLNRNNRPLSIEGRLPEILTVIRQRKRHEPEIGSSLSAWLGTTVLHESVLQEFQKYSKDFFADEKCNHCGTCEKVCPRKNIHKEKDSIVWHDNCELCFACLNWCPQKAIRMKGELLPPRRSHHPDITISNIID
jgi:ferredoxin